MSKPTKDRKMETLDLRKLRVGDKVKFKNGDTDIVASIKSYRVMYIRFGNKSTAKYFWNGERDSIVPFYRGHDIVDILGRD